MPPLNLYIASLAIGKPVQASLVRDGKPLTVSMIPQRRERAQPHQREYKQWGITGRNLSIWTAIEMKRKNKNGLLVTSIGNGGPAGQAKPPLQGGDIILKVNSLPINNMNDLTTVTKKMTGGKEEAVPLLVGFVRGGEDMMTVVRVGIVDLNDPGREPVKPWVPVATQVLTTDLAEQLKIEAQGGVRVTQVYDGSNGAKKFKVGDIILELDDKPIPASQPNDIEVFPTMVRAYRIGTTVTLTMMRGGQKLKFDYGLEKRPQQPREMPRYQDHDFDFTVRDVAYIDRMRARWTDRPTGLLVETVEEGGWAALGRLSPGDLLMTVDGKPVSTVAEIKKTMDQVKAQKKTSVIFKVRRGVHNLFLEIEPLWKQDAQ